MGNKGFLSIEFVVGGLAFLIAAAVVVPTIYGLVLAFKASILLGIIVFILEPSPSIIGWIALFGRADVCHRAAEWLHLPF